MYISIALPFWLWVYFTDYTTPMLIYTEQAAQLVAMCVSRYSGRSSGLWTAGFGRGFFHKMDSSVTHTHIKWCRECTVALTLHRGGIWEGGKMWHTVRVEWLVFKSTGAKQIFINHFIYLQFSAGVPQLKGEVHQKREL